LVNDNPNLEPGAEFDEPTPPIEPAAPRAPAAPPAVTKAELDAVKSELSGKLAEIDTLKSKTAIVDKLHEVFAGSTEDPRDAYVKKEIRRLVPELDDLAKVKEILPAILETLGASYEEKQAEKAWGAVEHMKGLMEQAGLDPKDDDAVGYMEEVLTREIKANPELTALWRRGNIKAAVNKAFDKASSKLFAPVRARVKRSAVSTITESPKATPRGQAPSPANRGGRTVDFSDTSREGVNKIHDAAFDALLERLDRD
jgi:hypothetical protein